MVARRASTCWPCAVLLFLPHVLALDSVSCGGNDLYITPLNGNCNTRCATFSRTCDASATADVTGSCVVNAVSGVLGMSCSGSPPGASGDNQQSAPRFMPTGNNCQFQNGDNFQCDAMDGSSRRVCACVQAAAQPPPALPAPPAPPPAPRSPPHAPVQTYVLATSTLRFGDGTENSVAADLSDCNAFSHTCGTLKQPQVMVGSGVWMDLTDANDPFDFHLTVKGTDTVTSAWAAHLISAT